MTVNLTYDGTISRVRIAASAAPSNADAIKVERSTDQIRWTTVRGGAAKTLVTGAATVDDYEFSPDVVNYYRVSYLDNDPHTHVNTGTGAAADNAPVSPGLPTGWAPGDAHYLLASIRSSGTGTVNTPAGWTQVVVSGNVALFSRRAVAGDVAPTVTFAGGVAGDTTLAQLYGRRGTSEIPASSATLLNGSAQNIAYPGLTVTVDNCLVLICGWKQDDWTSVDTIVGATENTENFSTLGNDAGQVWDRINQTTAANIIAGSFNVIGGLAAISRGIVVAFPKAAYYTRETSSITPTLSTIWLKSITRPFLNRPVTVTNYSDVSRQDRTGVFEISGRSYPIAVNDLRGSKQFDIEVVTANLAEASDLDLVLASGDSMFVHVPASCAVPGGYVTIGTTKEVPASRRSVRHIFTLPMQVVAAPDSTVVGVTYTCQGVLNDYATCADVLAANATCAILLENIGSAADLVVA